MAFAITGRRAFASVRPAAQSVGAAGAAEDFEVPRNHLRIARIGAVRQSLSNRRKSAAHGMMAAPTTRMKDSLAPPPRTEEPRVGKEGVSTCRTRGRRIY